MKSKVFFTREITPESLIRIYNALNTQLKGKVAVKISTGEPGGHNFLDPNLIKKLVNKLDGTIVETCTGFNVGKRYNPETHWQTFKDHGFTAIAPCDLLDENGTIKLPIKGGKHLHGYCIVGDHIANYNSTLVLSHFKGHLRGGFGGALKNVSIGFSSANGKVWIHTTGKSDDYKQYKNCEPIIQDEFLESMAEACQAIISYFKPENMAYINVANKLSIDCDCVPNPKDPEMADIGVFASLDPVALDQCCYDAVVNSNDPKKDSLIKRMDEKHGVHTLEVAEKLGVGSRQYELINID